MDRTEGESPSLKRLGYTCWTPTPRQHHQQEYSVLFKRLALTSKQNAQPVAQYSHKVDPAEAEQFDQLHHVSWTVVHCVLPSQLAYRCDHVQARLFLEFILATGQQLQHGQLTLPFIYSDCNRGLPLCVTVEQAIGDNDDLPGAEEERFQGLISVVQLADRGASEPPRDIAEKARTGPSQTHLGPRGFVQAQAPRFPERSPE